jgi:excisionase family DNA binding protein
MVEILPNLVNREQARRFLGNISERTLTSLIANGELKATYIGRRTLFNIQVLEAFAKRGTSARYKKK